MASATIYLGFIAAFLLPFVSASCQVNAFESDERVQTDVLTGWQLIRGDEPSLFISGDVAGQASYSAAERASAERQVRGAIESARRAATGMFVISAVLLCVATASAALAAPRAFASALFFGGLLHALSFVTFAFAGNDFGLRGPNIHHHSGAAVAGILAIAGPSVTYWAAKPPAGHDEHWGPARLFLLGFAIGGPLLLIAIFVGLAL